MQQYKAAGDINMLGELYQRYMELVYGVCLKYMKEPEEAKDCVISIFEELTVKLRKYQVDNFRAWLFQLAKNHCLMKIRVKKGYSVSIDETVMYFPENMNLNEAVEKEHTLSTMEYCIGQLPADQKTAIELFYLEQKCYKEIAASFNTDTNKVRSFIQNGRRNLKICMEKQAAESTLNERRR